ncbi:MFS transporter [Chloroflexota bacterium]
MILIKRRKFPRIFFGWWTVLAGGLLALWGHGYHSYGFSALFKPIASELGFSRAATSVPTAIGRLEGGFEGPLSGWLSDRYGPKWIVISGVFLVGLSLILMYYISSLWAFYIVWGVMLGTGINIALSVPFDTAIANWFVKKRGLALSIKWVFSGLSGALVMPLIAWLITVQDWRMTCVIGGLVMWFVGLPLAWFSLKRHRPEYYGLLPDGTTTEEKASDVSQMIDRGVKYAGEVQEIEFTLRQAMRTPAYWLIIAAHAGHGLVTSGLNIHCIPLLTDIGIEPVRAAGMMVIYISVSIPFRFIGGLIADRVKKDHLRFLMGGAYLIQGVGFAVFVLNQTIAMIYVWFILYGIGMGIGFAAATMAARYFGRKAFGSIWGSKMMFMAPFSMIAPIYAGWVYDTTGSYIGAFTLFIVALVFSAVLMTLALPPKTPAEVTDVRKIV